MDANLGVFLCGNIIIVTLLCSLYQNRKYKMELKKLKAKYNED